MAARKTTTKNAEAPVKLLIAAMGGEGGGVLTSWIVGAARRHGLPVQATSIPGVAQRTGATTYYIEIVPTPYDKLKGKEPVLDLYPAPGDIDITVATELVETGRMLEKGFVNPDRTTLIASTHRVYTLTEKMAMADGRIDDATVLEAARNMAKRALLFDMERAAQEAGSIINAVVLGAVAGSGLLPIPSSVFEEVIKEEGKAVKANLAGFAAGLAYAQGKVVEVLPKPAEKPAAEAFEPTGKAKALKERILRDYPAEVQALVLEACGRCLDYQDARYAELYLDRLDGVRLLAEGEIDFIRETARYLGLRMIYEDVIRVAQLKTRASRFARVRAEVQATPDQLVRVTEFLKPGPAEVAQVLPPSIARPILHWADRNPTRARKYHMGMHIRTDTVFGFLRVRLMAAMRRLRRIGYGYKHEQAWIEDWLNLVRFAAEKDAELAREVAETARLIKGYSDTNKRGQANFARIVEAVVEPALADMRYGAAEIRKAREAALADPEGGALEKALAEIAASAKKETGRAAAE